MPILHLFERSDRSRYFEAALPLIQSAGFQVVAVTVRERGEIHNALAASHVRTYALGTQHARDYPRATRALRQIINQTGAAIVHSHEPISGAIAGGATFLGHSVHLFQRHHKRSIGWQRVFAATAAMSATRVIAVSHDAAEGARREFPGKEATVVHNGIPHIAPAAVEERNRIRSELGIQESENAVAIIAHLRPEKGHLTLLRAVERLSSGTPSSVQLIVVGDGPELSNVMLEAGRHPHLRVRFVGHQRDIRPWLIAADVVAIPSHAETFGLAAVEAMSAERPIVASAIGGLQEIFEHDKSGVLVPADDVLALSQAISALLSDKPRAAALAAAAGVRYRTHFTIQAMVERWLNIYAEFLPRG